MRKKFVGSGLALTLVLSAAPLAQRQGEGYDYWRVQRAMIQRGEQAIFMCNGLFTSNRTIEQVFAQELKYVREPIGTPAGGDYVIDREKRAVAIGKDDGAPVMRAAFREGLGCVVLAPNQTFDDIASLPQLTTPPPPGNAARTPWPNGDLVEKQPRSEEHTSELQSQSNLVCRALLEEKKERDRQI